MMMRPLFASKKWVLLTRFLASIITINVLLNFILEVPTASPSYGPQNQVMMMLEENKSRMAMPTKEMWSNATTRLRRTVFYNIFLNSQTKVTFFRSLKIVDEQLEQIPNGTTIYFTIIGGERYFGNTGHDICHKYPSLDCVLLGDHKDGGEEQTLGPLFDFCVSHPTDRVTYIHDKGSFRHSSGNTINRRRATLGAVSDECLTMPLRNYPCNMCGTKYQYKPHQVYQANMWTAECSYIRQLVPPVLYREKRQALFERLWEENKKCLSRPPDRSMADTPWAWNLSDTMFLRNVGLGRYALERWMLHHPSMIPCDLLPNATLKSMTNPNHKFRLTKPDEWGKFVSQKVKARATWLLQQEYTELYPNVPINDVQAKDHAKPKPRPCW